MNKIIMKTATFVFSVLLIVSCGGSSSGGNNSELREIKGTLKDSSGISIPNANVTIAGELNSAVTNEEGEFLLETETQTDSLTLLISQGSVGNEVPIDLASNDSGSVDINIIQNTLGDYDVCSVSVSSQDVYVNDNSSCKAVDVVKDPAPCNNDTLKCGKNEFCSFATGSCGVSASIGSCKVIPDICNELYGPVCGCNSKTYDNPCFAEYDGQSILKDSAC